MTAAIELARRGASLLRAKRVLEEMIERGRAFVRLPMVEDAATLVRALEGCGIGAGLLGPPASVDVRTIREGLGITQEQFALRFGLDPDAVRNWESARRVPDTAARSYLQVIARDPGGVERALLPAAG